MNENGVNWSLWAVDALGTLLLTEDRGHALVQSVDIELGGDSPVAVSRSPSGRRTVLEGEGGHTELFETALVNHLAVFEIDRANASRIEAEDLAPVIAAPMRLGGRP
ncbi:hypothetical protein OIU34_21300 [Pararhizobium sp. BT-229]|uniref:hypothetical protein n=1 Tax=Pararhizobium sp. BT-229 TaxID=2986923 RepID=UPI0021F7831C|nr:hypothetical protein [Pararhizobium sp. BT-229]MCV9964429.1 hypothetical protein [Pararhizobium sp. BT-229]